MKFLKKKLLTIVLAIVLALSINVNVFAVDEFPEDDITSNSALLIDADSGKVLVGKNADEQIEPASTAKLMTALIAVQKLKLDEKVTVGNEVTGFSSGASLLKMEPGEELTVKDLLYAMMLISGNDAAAAIAVHVSGSIDKFVTLMNKTAKEFGMDDTTFTNPHGVHNADDTTFTTAADMGKLARQVFKNKQLMEIVGTKTYTIKATNKHDSERDLESTNRLIYTGSSDQAKEVNKQYIYSYANGMKTGSTPYAFGCLVASATKDDMNLIALIYGDKSDNHLDRWTTAKKLFDYGFNNYQTLSASTVLDGYPISVTVQNVATNDSEKGKLELTPVIEDGSYVTIPKDDSTATDVTMSDITPASGKKITAPIKEGDIVGSTTFSVNGNEIGTFDLKAARTVYAAGQEEEAAENSAVSTMDQVDVNSIQNPLSENLIWLWLIIPGILILFLIIRAIVVNRRRNIRRRRNYHRSYKRRAPARHRRY